MSACVVFAESSQYSVTEFRDEYPTGVYIRPTCDGIGIEPSPFTSIPYAFWWFMVTATTVGYGDDYPTTTSGRFVGLFTFYLGLMLLALPLSIVGQSFSKFFPAWVESFTNMGRKDKENHSPKKSAWEADEPTTPTAMITDLVENSADVESSTMVTDLVDNSTMVTDLVDDYEAEEQRTQALF